MKILTWDVMVWMMVEGFAIFATFKFEENVDGENTRRLVVLKNFWKLRD